MWKKHHVAIAELVADYLASHWFAFNWFCDCIVSLSVDWTRTSISSIGIVKGWTDVAVTTKPLFMRTFGHDATLCVALIVLHT